MLHTSLGFSDLRITLTSEQADEMWKTIASELSTVLQGHGGEIPDSVVPFDAASDVTMDHQRWDLLIY